jgi:hypothetical protein
MVIDGGYVVDACGANVSEFLSVGTQRGRS